MQMLHDFLTIKHYLKPIGPLVIKLNQIWIKMMASCSKKTLPKMLPTKMWFMLLTHWGWVMHIRISKLTIIGSNNGLAPGRRQTIIWTNDGILSIGPLGTNFSEILIGIQTFSFKKMHLIMSSAKWRPFCLCLNVLRPQCIKYCTTSHHSRSLLGENCETFGGNKTSNFHLSGQTWVPDKMAGE